MIKAKTSQVESSIGQQETDSTGSPIGVVRMDVEKSYAKIGFLLQEYINEGNQEAWQTIKQKIDYTYQGLDLQKGRNSFSKQRSIPIQRILSFGLEPFLSA